MLTGGADPLYRRALGGPHEPWARIDVYDGLGTLLQSDLTFLAADVSATLTSRVTRSCSFDVHEDLYPVLPTDLLAPYGNFIRAYRGVRLGDSNTVYSWQVFEGRIQDVRLSSAGVVQVSCSDRAADVIDFGFVVPQNSSVGILASNQVKQLIADGFPGASFGTFDDFAETMPQLTWESDRGSALDEIAQSLGAFWYALADGSFVLRRIPWTVPGVPVMTLFDGDGGTVVDYRVTRSRSEVYNVISVTGERADGTEPVYAVSEDNNPASPTFVDGRFGRRHRVVHLQTPSSQGAVQTVANDLLRSSIALTESWDLSLVADASLELGDVVDIEAAGRTDVIQVIQGFTLPLDSGPMNVSLRSQVIGLLEVS